MTQSAMVMAGPAVIHVELPAPEHEVLPGVRWGAIEAFPSPAYWAYQVMARRMGPGIPSHRLGSTLAEEVGACLLGGHGIPAVIGLAAFRHVRDSGMFSGVPTEEELFRALSQPLIACGRKVRYRFARQKARYLSSALDCLARNGAPIESGRALRDWLLQLPGIGYKTASWVARNWLHADDVAILDIHVLRAGALAGLFSPELTVARDYLKIEAHFLQFACAMGIRASELDAVIWSEMMASPLTVASLMGGHRRGVQVMRSGGSSRPRRRPHERRPDAGQARLIK